MRLSAARPSRSAVSGVPSRLFQPSTSIFTVALAEIVVRARVVLPGTRLGHVPAEVAFSNFSGGFQHSFLDGSSGKLHIWPTYVPSNLLAPPAAVATGAAAVPLVAVAGAAEDSARRCFFSSARAAAVR